MFEITQLAKTFYLHTQQQAEIPVVANVGFVVQPGECVALTGESGSGKIDGAAVNIWQLSGPNRKHQRGRHRSCCR